MKPMLAAPVDLDRLKFPVLASAKLDGIRTLIVNGKAVTRSLKPIPNVYIRETLERHADVLDGFDGEIIVGDPNAPDVFAKTTSAVMSRDGEPEFAFYVFDRLPSSEGVGYQERMDNMPRKSHLPRFVSILSNSVIADLEELSVFEQKAVEAGFEGVMLRDPNGRYKFGRSTVREGILLKVKRFEDIEATVVGYEELHHNDNAAELDNLGHTKRSTSQAGMVAGGTLGALVCSSPLFAETFRVGTGFTAADRDAIWSNRQTHLGQLAKVKYQACGTKDKPRIPVFLGFRDPADL